MRRREGWEEKEWGLWWMVKSGEVRSLGVRVSGLLDCLVVERRRRVYGPWEVGEGCCGWFAK